MKFSGVFIVAEVWFTAKLNFSVFERVCERAELLFFFAKIFHPFQCSTKMWLLFTKRIFGVFIYSKTQRRFT